MRVALALGLIAMYVGLSLAAAYLFNVRAAEVAAWAAVVAIAINQARKLDG